jgi:hypothetical protein
LRHCPLAVEIDCAIHGERKGQVRLAQLLTWPHPVLVTVAPVDAPALARIQTLIAWIAQVEDVLDRCYFVPHDVLIRDPGGRHWIDPTGKGFSVEEVGE